MPRLAINYKSHGYMHTLTPFPLARSIIKARELLDNWLCNQLASGSRLKQWEGARVSPFNLNLTTPPPHPTKDAFHSGHSSHHSCGQPSKVAATPNSETILLQQHAARVNRSSPITDQRSAITDHHVGGNSSSSPSNRRDQKNVSKAETEADVNWKRWIVRGCKATPQK